MAQQPKPEGDFMPKVDLQKDRKFLSQAQLDYMRLAQQQNADRVNRLKKIRRTNLLTAGVLGVSVFAIFGYSMWAVGSEKFLDEFEDKPASKS
ncbi:cytochrome c oxidase assembly factor 3, mitochondrial-like [Folsomia candida]|uniref:cytochrome c oxidase assembly factor 3, mitochondrial-like n=1 Tax=Folsomia candida TaxID=158441 RepID=UPI000B8F220C|nr:cytochrome c oxidase assembly factor 3, mitochondrial-like [Folsomia candida]